MTGRTTCVIAGGGPAGMVLGLLLARAGIGVTVLEKHADFLRDFRGDTVHPTTLSLLDDLGLFDRFDALPHSKVREVTLPTDDGGGVRMVDFGRLPLRHPYIAMVPQWDLLDLLADAGREQASFDLRMEHEVTGLIRNRSGVHGVTYRSPGGEGRIEADLVVACDGRWSPCRSAAGLTARQFPVGIDVWWCRIPTSSPVGESLLPRVSGGAVVVAIPREGYLQVARLGVKGTDSELCHRGIEAFRAELASVLPELGDDIENLRSMDDVRHLDVRVDRLPRWHVPGMLCIGDAAHAMSPVGGVGINLAVQDAVAAARILAGPLTRGEVRERDLARVHRRRVIPAVLIQGLQRVLHAGFIEPALQGRRTNRPPAPVVAVLRRFPVLAAVPAAVVGIGPLPERAPGWARRPASPSGHVFPRPTRRPERRRHVLGLRPAPARSGGPIRRRGAVCTPGDP